MRTISVRLRVRRTLNWQEYEVHVPRDAYVLDALEAARAQDSSLLYRHACHHASCGSCGLRINGREHLPCITPLTKFKTSHRKLRLEPLRNFPIMGDLLVDFGPFMKQLDKINLPPIRCAESLAGKQVGENRIERISSPDSIHVSQMPFGFNRLENCIECGLCISACPVAGSDAQYIGPAASAAAGRVAAEPRNRVPAEVLSLVNREHGLWRCHAAFECTEVCPADVDPAGTIMALRSNLLHFSRSLKLQGVDR